MDILNKIRFKIIQNLGRIFPTDEILFFDIPNFKDMKNTFSQYFNETCFLEPIPYSFWRDVRIARAAILVSAGGVAKFDCAPNAKRIELWHGTCLFKKVNNWSYRNITSDYVVVAPSTYLIELYAKSFGAIIKRVKPLGVPKTDIFFDGQSKTKIINQFFKQNSWLKGKKIYLFCPTFRGKWPNEVYYRTGIDFSKIAEYLNQDEVLLVKMHPALNENGGKHNVSFLDEKIINVTHLDINELLFVCDVLVSDYSGVIFDAVLLNKPIFIYAEDIDIYEQERGFVIDYRNIIPFPILEKPDEQKFVSLLRNVVINKHTYDYFKSRFLESCDGFSTKRVLDEISVLLGKSYKKSQSFNGEHIN